MPIKFRKNCKICIAMRHSRPLQERVYASKAFVKGGEPLSVIAREYKLQYPALIAHSENHMTMSDDSIAEVQMQKLHAKNEKKAIQTLVRTQDARQTAIDKLFDKLQTADMDEMSARDVYALLLKATKDSDDVQAKKKDQDIDVMKMMQGVRSGEVLDVSESDEFDPWEEAEEGTIATS